MFSSLLEVIKEREELTECSKLLRKECSTWFLGAVVSEIGDWCQLISAIIGVLTRSKASWEGKNRPNATYRNSKEEEKAILDAQIQFHERVREPN